MKQGSLNIGSVIAGIVLGAAVTVGIFTFWVQPQDDAQGATGTDTNERKPLYWVAPMDAAYKRDKPGKSPMGMDLIPVYADEGGGADAGPGTIKVSPDVVNSLGVRTAVAQRKVLHLIIKTVGYVGYDEDQLIHIHPRVEGWVEKLYVGAAGDPVKEGQPLYEIYSPELVNAQEELLLAIDRKNQRLIKASEDRLKALQLPASAITKLRASKEVMQTVTFFAPQSGVVDNLDIRQGVFIKPGSTIMSIGSLKQVWVDAEVFERQASEVAVGVPVSMSLEYLPGRVWQGSVDYVYPTLDIKTRTVKVRLRFDNADEALKPNMFAQVVIHAKNSKDTLLVPREAVIRTGNMNRVVLALGDGRFKSVEVEVGRFDEHSVEILEGLKKGERIVTSAQFLLDSESSKTSDFKRMNSESDEIAVATTAWVEATINSAMEGHRMVNVKHKAIKAWGWPAMTMDFAVSKSVSFSKLEKDKTLNIEIRKLGDNQYEIADVRDSSAQVPRDTVLKDTGNADDSHKGMNHEGMNHEGMNHKDMNREGMNHKDMNHEGMNHEGMNHKDMNYSGDGE